MGLEEGLSQSVHTIQLATVTGSSVSTWLNWSRVTSGAWAYCKKKAQSCTEITVRSQRCNEAQKNGAKMCFTRKSSLLRINKLEFPSWLSKSDCYSWGCLQVWSLVLLSGLRIQHCLELSAGCRGGSDLALLWLRCRPVTTGQIRFLAWEPPYAAGAALKSKKKEKQKKKEIIIIINKLFYSFFQLIWQVIMDSALQNYWLFISKCPSDSIQFWSSMLAQISLLHYMYWKSLCISVPSARISLLPASWTLQDSGTWTNDGILILYQILY